MVEARPLNLNRGRTTMIVIGLILAVVALGFFCWLLFNLAVYALPCFLGLSAGFWLFHHSAGLPGAAIATFLVGTGTFALGRIAFATIRAPAARLVIALLFAAPAVLAGYYAALGLARNANVGPYWAEAFAVLGAFLVGGTSFARIAMIPVGDWASARDDHNAALMEGR